MTDMMAGLAAGVGGRKNLGRCIKSSAEQEGESGQTRAQTGGLLR